MRLLLLLFSLCIGLATAQDRRLERKLELTPKKEADAVVTRALTWLTGGAEENDYVSVGRLANYFGFVRFRVASGHSLTRGGIGQRTWAALDASQRERMAALLDEQWPALERCREAREAINRRIEGLLVGGDAAEREVLELGERFGVAEAELGLAQAQGFAAIVAGLTAEQRTRLAALRAEALAGDLGGYRLPGADRAALRERLGELDGRRGQELWNLCSRLMTWVTGTPADNDYDTAGKPSQHFGFVDLRIESGHGVTRAGIADAVEQILTPAQGAALREVAHRDEADFLAFFAARARVNRALERGLQGQPIDGGEVRVAGAEQGLAEARMTWRQAQAFLQLRSGLDERQATAMAELRGRFVLPRGKEDGPTESLPEGEKMLVAGQRVFALCALCHPLGDQDGVGPSLRGVLGRPVASRRGFVYSPAMRERGGRGERWTRERLDAFLTDPMRDMPGTRMPFSGLRSAEQRQALLAWLDAQDDDEESSPGTPPGTLQGAPQQVPVQEPKPSRTLPAWRPNFVFVLAEAVGFADTSVALQDSLPDAHVAAAITPQLARLAREGVRMPAFYVSAPRCTPTRASFLTGMSAARLGMTYVNETGGERRGGGGSRSGGRRDQEEQAGPRRLQPPSSETELPRQVTTIAELLHDAGYATAHFGKWHVGRATPGEHGFDVDDGANTNQGPGRDRTPNPEQAFAITDRGIAFVREQVAAGRPFYLQLSHYGGGSADESRPETRQALAAELRGERGKAGWQRAILADVDHNLGRVLDLLDELGIAGETYVVFSSDHGAAGRNSNLPLRGGKGSLFEGGLRVPFVVRGPQLPAGGEVLARGSCTDLLPTVAELASVKRLPEALDGVSLVPALRDPAKGRAARPGDAMVVHFPHYDLGYAPASALYWSDFKLIRDYETGRCSLFDVRNDPQEAHDLADDEVPLVLRLERMLDESLRASGARMPTPDPAFGR
ncbi:MAG: sulfatase-like hydrolase/transferase [Planctomycetes bacterium]|nr:sulfatase-like hydrolase/transferase [Planctomycetota bacterium]